jgi:dynein heavy chain
VFLCNLLSIVVPIIAPLHCILSLPQIFISEQREVPLEAVTYLVGECNYGGCVTDDWDRRALNTMLTDFINIRVITDDNYVFSMAGKLYGLPAQYEYTHYIQHIQV